MSRLLLAVLASLAFVVAPLSRDTVAAPDDIALARAHVTINADGLFVVATSASRVDRARLHAIFDPLNAQLSRVDRSLRPTIQAPPRRTSATAVQTSAGGHLAAPLASWCGYVPRWAFEAFAWYVIIVGGVTATVGLFADATIFGLPAGAVLGAAGIWIGASGSFMLWYVDTYMPPEGVYECIF